MKQENPRAWSPEDKRYQRVTEKKRQVLHAAQRAFIRNGYVGTSMDTIAQEAGVSRMTVYRQYASKETLFIACMQDHCRDMLIPEKFETAHTLEEAEGILLQYGRVLVDMVTKSESVMFYRMLIAEIGRFSGLGEMFYVSCSGHAASVVEKILARLFDKREARLRAQAFISAALGGAYQRVVLDVNEAEEMQEEFAAQIRLAATIVLR